MKYEEVVQNISNKIFHPIYFLTGDEPYFIDKLSKLIEKSVLAETEREFNQQVLYGRDVDIRQIVSMAREYPVFANYRVIIVREAQNLNKIEKDENMLKYIKNPVKSTILVFDHKHTKKKIDGRTEFVKQLKKNHVFFESKKIYDNQVPMYIDSMIKAKGLRIDNQSKMMLAESLGNNLSKIDNEIGKLIINLKAGEQITPQLIEQHIGISKDFNPFELQNALGKRDVLKANRIINYFAANPKDNPATMIIIILYGYFRKLFLFHFLQDKSERNVAAELSLNPYFVRENIAAAKNYSPKELRKIISLLREFDLRSKGVESAPTEDGELLRELVFKILH